jgi:hypothetical protein
MGDISKETEVKRNLASIIVLTFAIFSSVQCTGQSLTVVRQSFKTPPANARPLMRFWWFGGAVTDQELEREIKAMKAGGIGGFEIQPVYPLALDDPQTGFHNNPYLSPGFLHELTFANQVAVREGMRVDLTLASGWPYGGPHIPITQASSMLRVVPVTASGNDRSVPVPAMENGEKLIAVFSGTGDPTTADPSTFTPLPLPTGFRLTLPGSNTAAVFFISSRTGQQVKRPEIGAEGYVLDHFDKSAVENHLNNVGEKLIKAFGDHPPYSVFSDSLEVYAANWTPDLLAQFKQRRGYDLTPHLMQMYSGTDDESASVRHDWGQTLTELINENYLKTINDWALAHHTRFRSQSYGSPAVDLSSNALVTLPEGEGPQWRRFSTTRWATSAGHLYDRPVISSETWTWLHSTPFRAVPLDMKAEADLFFLQGINQFIGHGWPYTPPSVSEPGWSFYAAAVFNDHNPWYGAMPDLMAYLQRLSYLLRQGIPTNDVAVFLPTDDIWSSYNLIRNPSNSQSTPHDASVTNAVPRYVTPALTEAVLNDGHNLDYIDSQAIASTDKLHTYKVLVLPHVQRIDPATYRRIAEYVKQGGKVITVGDAPSAGSGLVHFAEDTKAVQNISQTLFSASNANAIHIADDSKLGDALSAATSADMTLTPATPVVGFIHRHLVDSEIYFVVNTSNHSVHTSAAFGAKKQFAELWDPQTAKATIANADSVQLDLAPYESTVVVFTDKKGDAAQPLTLETQIADISKDWMVKFKGDAQASKMDAGTSWTDNPSTQFYSGEAVYTKDVDLTQGQLKTGQHILVDFGEGTPFVDTTARQQGTHVLINSPVRETAVVYINGVRAGSVWCPPYRLDITAQLHAGTNHIELRVGNTDINTLAGRTLTDYRLLNLRYTERFTAQNMQHLVPLPSGVLGQVKLVSIGVGAP